MKFLKSVAEEMKIVAWPTAKENRRDTSTVVLTGVFYALFFAAVDAGILGLLKLFIF